MEDGRLPFPAPVWSLQEMFASKEFQALFEHMREYTERTGSLPKITVHPSRNRECGCRHCHMHEENPLFVARL